MKPVEDVSIFENLFNIYLLYVCKSYTWGGRGKRMEIEVGERIARHQSVT